MAWYGDECVKCERIWSDKRKPYGSPMDYEHLGEDGAWCEDCAESWLQYADDVRYNVG